MSALIRVRIPSPLHSYTGGAALVEARGSSLRELVDDLDRRFPGLRFRVVDEQDRIREHMRFFIGEAEARSLDDPLDGRSEVMIVAALSGG